MDIEGDRRISWCDRYGSFTNMFRLFCAVLFIFVGTAAWAQTSDTSTSNLTPPKGAGTGFYLAGSNGMLLTAAHVVHDCAHIVTRRPSGQFLDLAKASIDVAADLALLRDPTSPRGLGLLIAKAVMPLLGEPVMVYGYGLFGPLHGAGSILVGNVTGFGGTRLDTRDFDPDLIRISTDLKVGFSGGPVVDGSGGVIGVASSVETIGLRGSNDVRTTATLNFVAGGNALQKFLDGSGISYSKVADSRSRPTTTIATALQYAAVPLFCVEN
jgi:S1-C subfamily serine protease